MDLKKWLDLNEHESGQLKLRKAIEALKRLRLHALTPSAANMKERSTRRKAAISESKARHALAKTLEVEVAGGMMVKAVVDAQGSLEMRPTPEGFAALKAFVTNFELVADESTSPSPSSASAVEFPKGVYLRRDHYILVLNKSSCASLPLESSLSVMCFSTCNAIGGLQLTRSHQAR